MGRPRVMPEAGVFRAALRALAQVDPGAAADLVRARRDLRLAPHAPEATPATHPHDVIYVIATGRGLFHREAERASFAPGDAIFVPAGAPHRFEDAAVEELRVWIAFWRIEEDPHG
jgi:mannose-6-phosphate isomerase-like protein (cupin superfamily)